MLPDALPVEPRDVRAAAPDSQRGLDGARALDRKHDIGSELSLGAQHRTERDHAASTARQHAHGRAPVAEPRRPAGVEGETGTGDRVRAELGGERRLGGKRRAGLVRDGPDDQRARTIHERHRRTHARGFVEGSATLEVPRELEPRLRLHERIVRARHRLAQERPERLPTVEEGVIERAEAEHRNDRARAVRARERQPAARKLELRGPPQHRPQHRPQRRPRESPMRHRAQRQKQCDAGADRSSKHPRGARHERGEDSTAPPRGQA